MAFEYAWAKRLPGVPQSSRSPHFLPPPFQLSQPNNKFALVDNALNAASFSVAAPVAPAAAVASA